MKRINSDLLTPLCQLITYMLIITAVMFLVQVGSRLYQRVTEQKNANEHLRSTVAYIHNQAAANDAMGVQVKSGIEGDMLVFPITGGEYELCVYAYEGNLIEEMKEKDAALDPASGDIITQVESFEIFAVSGNETMKLEIDGMTAWVNLRSCNPAVFGMA